MITASEVGTGDLRYKINTMKVQPEILADVAGVPRGASKIRYVIYLVHTLVRIIVKYGGAKQLGTWTQ